MLARRVGADGRTRAYLNGRTASVGDLRDIGGALLSFYGQHEHRKLTLAGAQLQILDGLLRRAITSSACARARRRSHARASWQSAAGGAARALRAARARARPARVRARRRSTRSLPSEQEHEQLLGARERLRRLDALRSAAGRGADALAPRTPARQSARHAAAGGRCGGRSRRAGRCRSGARRARRAAARPDHRVPGARGRAARLLRARREPRARRGARAARRGGASGRSLEALEERLAAIERLARKHGGSIEAVLEHAAARARRGRSWPARRSRWRAERERACRRPARALERARAALRRKRAHAAAQGFARGGARAARRRWRWPTPASR